MPGIAATMAISGTLRAFASDESSTVARTSAFSYRSLFVIKYCVGAWSLQRTRLHARPGTTSAHKSVSCARTRGSMAIFSMGMHRRRSGYIIHVA